MLKNYFLTTLRSALRQKGYTALNILGLTVGLVSAIFIFTWILDEVRFDRFHADGETIFNVMENQTYSENQIYTFASTPGLFGPTVKEEVPEIEEAARSTWGESLLFSYKDKVLNEEGRYADGSFFRIFSFHILKGNTRDPLPAGSSIAISKKLAAKYFGQEDPLGKLFKVDNRFDLKVTSVFDDLPKNSSIQVDFIVPFELYLKDNKWLEDWGNNGIRTFIKLKDANQMATVNEKIKGFIKKRRESSVVDVFLYPFEKNHLYGSFKNGKQDGGMIATVKLMGFVGLFIIVIACINFMNLATARSVNRSKEVGVRKVVGANRKSLVMQFIGESIAMAFVSLAFALIIVELLLPVFNLITTKAIALDFSDPVFVFPVLAITMFTGLLAGSYPAFFLSSFQPVKILKGDTRSALTGNGLRKVLVVFQFSLSVVFIISTIIIYQQITFMRNKDMGFNRENVLYFNMTPGIKKNTDALRTALLSTAHIEEMAVTSNNPMNVGSSTGDIKWPGKKPDDQVLIQVLSVSHEFIETVDIKLLEGRSFDRTNAADSTNFILNEEAIRRMGLNDALGQEITLWEHTGKIIGVAKNFHTTSYHNPFEPVILTLAPENANLVMVHLEQGKEKEAIADLEIAYKKFEQAYPFTYHFMDEDFEAMYRTDVALGKLANGFTFIAILISSIGLFGLASFTAEKRIKEIGVRKVLGASVASLVTLLCSDFTKLVVVALIVGSPLAYYLMKSMLEKYAFHIEIEATVFIITAASVLVLALATVVVQSLRAALTNPTKSLRSE